MTASAAAPKVAIVAPSLAILGGQGVQARSLIDALAGEGVAVTFVAVNPQFPRGLHWLRRVPVLRTLFNQCLYFVGLRRLRSVDVVHVFCAAYWSFVLAPVPALLAARLFGKRLILNYHSGEADDHLRNWGLWVHPWLRWADEIVVPSSYLQQVFAEYGYRSTVVRNIIDISAFAYRPREHIAPQILSNRNLERHYGVDITLQAFALVKQQRSDARLTVAGYGSERDRLKRWVHKQGLTGVAFVGRVEPGDMPQLYAQADIFVNASLIDNQPLSILEAFAAGLPVISTPTGDIPAMLEHGRLGTLVPQGDAEALAAAMLGVLAQPDAALRAARAARQALSLYSWETIGSQWLLVYSRVARGDSQRQSDSKHSADSRRDEPTAHL